MSNAERRFKKLTDGMRKHSCSPEDVALVLMFERYPKQIGQHFDDTYQYIREHCDKVVVDDFGPVFHKGFRQTDILPTGAQDMVVWKALSQDSCCFWSAIQGALR